MKSLPKILDEIRDIKPESSLHELEKFLQSVIYSDFINELHARIELLRDVYEDCPKNMYLETRGAIKVLRLLESIFEDMLENKKSEIELENFTRRFKNEIEPKDE